VVARGDLAASHALGLVSSHLVTKIFTSPCGPQ
jgi:hypothetical protein